MNRRLPVLLLALGACRSEPPRIIVTIQPNPARTADILAATVESDPAISGQDPNVTSTLRWFLDGVGLADGGGISGATTATLTLANVPLAAAGTYTALVTDGLGVVGSAAALTVQARILRIDTIQVIGGNLVLTWTGRGKLVVSTDITLPAAQWQDAPGANTVSPYTIPVSQIPGNVIFGQLVAQ